MRKKDSSIEYLLQSKGALCLQDYAGYSEKEIRDLIKENGISRSNMLWTYWRRANRKIKKKEKQKK